MYSYGGPTRSIEGLYNNLSIHYNCTVISPKRNLDGSKIDLINHNNVIYTDLLIPYLILNGFKYDFIWFNSFFEFKLIWLLFLKSLYKFNLVVSPRGQLSYNAIYTSKPLFKFIFIKFVTFFYKSIYFHSTSKEESKEIKKYFRNARIKEISNISSNEFFNNSSINKKFVFYSRIHKKKGLHILLDTLVKHRMNIELDIYGFIEDKKYWKECEENIKLLTNVNYCGQIKHGSINSLNNKYTFFIFPTLSENFWHVIIELISIGIIPLISKNTTPFDKIIDSKIGLNFNLENSSDIMNKILLATELSEDQILDKKTLVKDIFLYFDRNQNNVKKDYIKFIKSIWDYCSFNRNR